MDAVEQAIPMLTTGTRLSSAGVLAENSHPSAFPASQHDYYFQVVGQEPEKVDILGFYQLFMV